MMPIRVIESTCPLCGQLITEFDPTSLREVRQDAGLSLREWARRTKLSAGYLSDVELGRRRVTRKVAQLYTGLQMRAFVTEVEHADVTECPTCGCAGWKPPATCAVDLLAEAREEIKRLKIRTDTDLEQIMAATGMTLDALGEDAPVGGIGLVQGVGLLVDVIQRWKAEAMAGRRLLEANGAADLWDYGGTVGRLASHEA